MSSSNRRKFIGAAAALAVGTVTAKAATVAAKTASAAPQQRPPLVHHVFFWLKNPSSTADRDKLVEGVKTLAKIETVKELHVGILASTEKRDVVDTSWAVSELMFFNDVQGQATYQQHPVHLEFIKNYGHLWEKVIVYDAMQA
ncbi:MAG TPA: Dabb family protein [Puia sp.]|nr:Dabb family protein [Puia sp.]